MKGFKKILLLLLLMIPIFVYADGISLSTSSLTINEGKSATFTIKATSAAGRVDITSSNTNVATISSSSEFLDNSTVTITVNAKKEGTATITVNIVDVATYDGVELNGSKTLNVTVKKVSTTPSNPSSGSSTTKPSSGSSTTPSGDTPVVKEINHIEITKFEIVGYDINFDMNTSEYTIDISPNVSKIYISVDGKNFTVTGDREVNIAGVSQVFVTFKNDDEEKMYTINLNREEVVPSETPTPTTPEEPTKKTNNKLFIYLTIGFGALSIVLLLLLVTKKGGRKDTDVIRTVSTTSNLIANTSVTPTTSVPVTPPPVTPTPQVPPQVQAPYVPSQPVVQSTIRPQVMTNINQMNTQNGNNM